MVMRLPTPGTCSLQLVDDVVVERQAGKNAKFFAGIAPEWRERVQTYIDEAGSPQTVPLWPAVDHKRKSFLNLYSSAAEGSAHRDMLEDLRNHSLTLCPACGEAGTPNTLDHYLPKGKYPHFCITPHNIFPMCDACQSRKAAKTGDARNPRFFVHPYFDVFVAEQVISLKIHPPFDTPTFKLGVVKDLSKKKRKLLKRHIQELQIPKRYIRFFREQYRLLLRLVERMRETGQDIEANLDNFRYTAEEPSKNGWGYVFYESVLSNAAMLTYLRQGCLPTHL